MKRLHAKIGELTLENDFEMDPDDDCVTVTVLGLGDESITAFPNYGVDDLTELVEMINADPDMLRHYTLSE